MGEVVSSSEGFVFEVVLRIGRGFEDFGIF
jgi:hypothetical protein